jgi:glycosyltransferase involved in cell wall biosynthesis
MLWTLSKLNTMIPIEIIGVNNASTDRTWEIIEQSWVKRIDEPRKWVSYARQAWLEVARWEIVASTDADTQIPEMWIDTGLWYFDKVPDLVCFWGGSVVPWIHPTQRIIRVLPRIIRFFLWRWYFPHETASFGWANTFFNRQAAENIGGYALWFDLWEDNLIAQKMKSQWRIIGVANSNNVVLTSNRRANSFRKVIQMYWSNSKHVNPMQNQAFIVNKPAIFSDVR